LRSPEACTSKRSPRLEVNTSAEPAAAVVAVMPAACKELLAATAEVRLVKAASIVVPAITASEMSTGLARPAPWKRTVTVPAPEAPKVVAAAAVAEPPVPVFASVLPVGSEVDVTLPSNAFDNRSPAATWKPVPEEVKPSQTHLKC